MVHNILYYLRFNGNIPQNISRITKPQNRKNCFQFSPLTVLRSLLRLWPTVKSLGQSRDLTQLHLPRNQNYKKERTNKRHFQKIVFSVAALQTQEQHI